MCELDFRNIDFWSDEMIENYVNSPGPRPLTTAERSGLYYEIIMNSDDVDINDLEDLSDLALAKKAISISEEFHSRFKKDDTEIENKIEIVAAMVNDEIITDKNYIFKNLFQLENWIGRSHATLHYELHHESKWKILTESETLFTIGENQSITINNEQ